LQPATNGDELDRFAGDRNMHFLVDGEKP
jgi:hypothetical protein